MWQITKIIKTGFGNVGIARIECDDDNGSILEIPCCLFVGVGADNKTHDDYKIVDLLYGDGAYWIAVPK